ncbi:MAG: hypothetical protein F4Y86_04035 [Gammaproteobacteria bacterium]|nr:hypothetical protein [Gammaproteobacteria bacterium]
MALSQSGMPLEPNATMHLGPELERRAQASATIGLDLTVELRVADDPRIGIALTDGSIRFGALAEPDASFVFDSRETAAAILYEEGDFITAFMEAFMAGKVRSDGNLPFTFTLLSLFRPGLHLPTPD